MGNDGFLIFWYLLENELSADHFDNKTKKLFIKNHNTVHTRTRILHVCISRQRALTKNSMLVKMPTMRKSTKLSCQLEFVVDFKWTF